MLGLPRPVTPLTARLSSQPYISTELKNSFPAGGGDGRLMIEVRAVTKSFSGRMAVQDVSFYAPAGRITAFVGPNGAGKTTVLRMIAGLTLPDGGEVKIEGRPYAETSAPGETMGVFLSAESIPVGITAADHLSYVAKLKGLDGELAKEALSRVGLADAARTRVRAMSLGMRQRLGLAAAGLGDPSILVLDEPANGLDPAGVQWFREYLVHRARQGATVLLSSHHMAELAHVADRVVMIDDGRVIAEGSVEEFVATEQEPPVFVRSPEPERLTAALQAYGLSVTPYDEGLLVLGSAAIEVGRIAFAEGGGLSHLSIMQRSIEQTYFDRLESDTADATSAEQGEL